MSFFHWDLLRNARRRLGMGTEPWRARSGPAVNEETSRDGPSCQRGDSWGRQLKSVCISGHDSASKCRASWRARRTARPSSTTDTRGPLASIRWLLIEIFSALSVLNRHPNHALPDIRSDLPGFGLSEILFGGKRRHLNHPKKRGTQNYNDLDKNRINRA